MKIEAKDLRIGNWVISKLHKGLLTEIHTIMPNSVKLWANPLSIGYNLDEIEGIPITPDILEKAGALRLPHGYFIDKLKFTYEHNELSQFVRFHYSGKVVYLQYVHQLQNLYFALTGQELNIEL